MGEGFELCSRMGSSETERSLAEWEKGEFNSSLGKGGGFANSVIGKIATGSIASTGTISGEKAADSLMSYMYDQREHCPQRPLPSPVPSCHYFGSKSVYAKANHF